jgi:glucose/arabinose dehydrogenase
MNWRVRIFSRTRKPAIGEKRKKHGFRPRLEMLEERAMLAVVLPGFADSTVASGFSGPTAMDFSPDGRLWVLEQSGNVKLVHSDGTTFTALHQTVDSAGERGLLGIAFDPAFTTNHFVYVYYTNTNPGPAGVAWATGEHNQLSRFTVNDSNPLQPTFTNEAPILDWNNLSSATNHNGGAIHFGADGMLYADAGDNVQTFVAPQDGNTYRVSQSLDTLLGKQLRIDVSKFNSGVASRDDVAVGHLIPSNNPFVGTATGINQLIYALGLRNPYTFAVQPGTGRILINDVGENTWEEVDDSLAGGNYGWSGGNTDGFGHTPPSFAAGTYHDPLLAYNHSSGSLATGIAIVGGTFYNPTTTQFPNSYVGMYFYEDLNSGWIRYFNPNNPNSAANPDGNSVQVASGIPSGLRDLKVDAAGNLFYLSGGDGTVHKISYQAPKITTQPADQVVTQGQPATFNVVASGLAPLAYQWQHLIGSTWTNVGTNSPTFTISAATTADAGSYRVNVSNTAGSATSNTAALTVNQVATSTVAGRQLFYARSSRYDVAGASQSPLPFSDDNAIATDKSAYLPNGSTAGFGNISSYTRGLNGVMVDLLGGGAHTSITLANILNDFTFKVGNNATPGTWVNAPLPTAVLVRTNMNPTSNGAGTVSGADRVELIWADNAIQQKWLEVIVKPTANTGLAANDVFFFGNEIGNTSAFNTTAVARTGTADIAGVQTHGAAVSANIPISNTFDFDRDGGVGSGDIAAIQTHGTNSTTGLKLIHIAASGPFVPDAGLSAPVGPQPGVAAPTGAIILSAASGTAANQATIDSAPAGATIFFTAGTYTDLSIQPKNNQTFIGQFGAILTSQQKVHAFFGTGTGVKISNLVVDGYKTASQQTSIQGSDFWNVDHVEVRNSTAEGVLIGSHSSLTNSYVHDNGQAGIGADSANNHCVDVLISNDLISHNNPKNAFDVTFEAGGSKFWNVNGLTISHCEFSNNVGNGIWLDGDLNGGGNTNVTITNTWSHDNSRSGIFQEIGGSALITNNLVENNGLTTSNGDGIELDDSESVVISNNLIRNNFNAITLESYARTDTIHKIQNDVVTNNTIIANQGITGVIYFGAIPSFATGITFDYNQYTFAAAASFAWNGVQNDTWSQWRALGNDSHATFATAPH